MSLVVGGVVVVSGVDHHDQIGDLSRLQRPELPFEVHVNGRIGNGYISSDYYHYKKIKKLISSNPAFVEFKPLSHDAKFSGELIIRNEGTKQFREDVGSYFAEIYSCWSTAAWRA